MQFVTRYEEGYQRARQEGKPLLLFFTAKWCRFCQEMERDAFADRQVIQLSDRFVCVLVDADQDSGVCKDFGVRGFPTVQFISPDGVPMNRLVGRSGSIDLVTHMQAAIKASNERIAAGARQSIVR